MKITLEIVCDHENLESVSWPVVIIFYFSMPGLRVTLLDIGASEWMSGHCEVTAPIHTTRNAICGLFGDLKSTGTCALTNANPCNCTLGAHLLRFLVLLPHSSLYGTLGLIPMSD